LKKVNLTFL